MKNILILVIVFYIFILLQNSFLIYFNIGGMVLNLIFIAVVLLNLFEKPEGKLGFWSAFIGGFFLDVFSEGFLGFYILILLTASVFIKFIIKKNVRIPFIKSA